MIQGVWIFPHVKPRNCRASGSRGAGRGSEPTSGRAAAARARGCTVPSRVPATEPARPAARRAPEDPPSDLAGEWLLWLLVGTDRAGIRAVSLPAARHAPCQTGLSQRTRWTRSPPWALPTAAAGSPATASTGSWT